MESGSGRTLETRPFHVHTKEFALHLPVNSRIWCKREECVESDRYFSAIAGYSKTGWSWSSLLRAGTRLAILLFYFLPFSIFRRCRVTSRPGSRAWITHQLADKFTRLPVAVQLFNTSSELQTDFNSR